MKYLPGLIAVLLIASCSTSSTSPENLSVVVFGEASTPHFKKGSGPYRAAYNGIAGAIADGGFRVFDETAANLDDFQLGGSLSRADALDVARSMGRAVDVVVIFTSHVRIQSKGYAQQLVVTVDASATNVSSGRVLANASTRSSRVKIPPACKNTCLRAEIVDQVGIVAGEAGSILSSRLPNNPVASRSRSDARYATSYEVVFNGFTTDEMVYFEDRLEDLKGYIRSKIKHSDQRRLDLLYETRASESAINRALHTMVKEQDLRADVRFSGTHFRVDKITRPKASNTEADGYEWE